MKFILNLLILFVSMNLLAQSSIEFKYSDVYIGRNLNLNWKKTINDFSIYTGLTYHINRIDKTPYGTFIKKSAFAKKNLERFGLEFGLEYFLFENTNFKIGCFYNNQISFINQIHIMFYAYDTFVSNPESEFDYTYIKSEMIYGPFLTVDNVIGITLKNNLTNNFYLSTKGGFGLLFWKNTDDSVILIGGKKNNQSYNFTSFFSIGLGYTFSKKSL